MKQKKNVTFDDIAKYTNFSKTTISRYFNNPDSLTLENQEIISKALVDLDYKENKVARILANTVGLDPAQVIELRRLIRELGRTHTVILSSHILSEVKAVCDKALILSQGHLAAVVDLAAEERDLEELFLELTAPEETSDKKED